MPTYTRILLLALATCPVHAERPVNLVPNPSFEDSQDGLPVSWQWSPLPAKGTCTLDTAVKRSGECSAKLTNPTPQEPHVYCHLSTTVPLQPGRTYTLSCYVKSEDAGTAWIGGGDKWRLRIPFPRKAPDWQRVSQAFTVEAAEAQFRLLILSESTTKGLWIDDVQLEAGDKATEFQPESSLKPGETVLQLGDMNLAPNLLPDSSFETIDGNRPKHWMWDHRNTDATMTLDDTVVRSGKHSLRFASTTPFGANVYGCLTLVGGVAVEPETTYTLSYYVRGKQGGGGFVGGAARWRVRAQFVSSPDRWTRVTSTFTTEADEKTIPILVIIERPCEAEWIDDLKLEKAPRALPYVFEDEAAKPQVELSPVQPAPLAYRGSSFVPAWAPSRYPPDQRAFVGKAFWVEGFAFVPEALRAAEVSVELLDEAGKVVAGAKRSADLAAGATSLDFGWSPGAVGRFRGSLCGTVRNKQGREVAKSTQALELLTASAVEQKLAAVAKSDEQLAALLAGKRAKDDYLRVAHTVLTNFLGYAREDLSRDEVARAWDAAVQMESLAADAVAHDRSSLQAPRFQTGRLTLDGPCTLGKALLPDGTVEARRPVQMVGYGHFNDVRRDVEKFPGYGTNLIQIEFGPRSVLPTENAVDDSALNDFLAVADRCAKSNVSVNLLISPHYFPNWALEKWPELKDCTGGFLGFCVHAPEARQVLEKFLCAVIPRIKDHPALHSICLSNEPVSVELTKCRYTRDNWHQWLAKEHGTVARLNERWRAEYKSFDDLPVPEAKLDGSPLVYDSVRFNQEQFAGFHRWMADVIHGMAPDLPVHAKIMMSAHWGRSPYGIWSVDPELFGQLSQYNGNDCCKWYARNGECAADWLGENMAYDFQRSVADKPVFNSENHFILDRDLDVVPPEFIRNVLWQGAIHGQSATTIWVWNRAFDPLSDAAGSIMHRPADAAEVGRTTLDLNRLAPEVTALQRLEPEVVLLYSLASILNGDEHNSALARTYEALNSCGAKLGFVTERQLTKLAATGEVPLSMHKAKVLVLPSVTHASQACVDALARLATQGVKIVQVGKPFGALTEYGAERAPAAKLDATLDLPATAKELWQALRPRLADWGVHPLAEVVDQSGKPVWGVEWLATRLGDRLLANLSNYLRKPVRVRLLVDGRAAQVADRITADQAQPSLELPSLAPVLVECR